MKEITIGELDCGQRLDKYLAKYLSQAPKSFLYKMMRKKNIVLNGRRCEGNEKLEAGDTIRLFLADDTLQKFTGQIEAQGSGSDSLQVIYCDKHVMFANKPSGELTQRAAQSDISLNDRILAYVKENHLLTPEEMRACRPSVCNRLDRNTSGLVAAGISLPGLAFLSEQLKTREVGKYYLCLAAGRIDRPDRLKGFLAKDERSNQVYVAKTKEELPKRLTEDAQWIDTEFEPVQAGEGATLLLVHLHTGRSHQIRAHLASIGHPVIGDPKYGDMSVNRKYRASCGVRSQLLHAYRMQFGSIEGTFSYLSGKSFCAPLPKEFQRALAVSGISVPAETDADQKRFVSDRSADDAKSQSRGDRKTDGKWNRTENSRTGGR